jgi:uncharacterized protein (DUF1015 family)
MATRPPANWTAVPPQVLPFRALRYARTAGDLAQLVSPPYDVIPPEEQASLAAQSPYNAVHVELPPGPADTRYSAAAATLADWKQSGVLVPDPRPAFYLTETDFEYAGQRQSRRDLIAAVGVEPWSSGAVLPHEHTMPGPKADRLELLRSTHLTASPIWLMHREQPAALASAWSAAEQRAPDAAFAWRGEQHRLWVVDEPAVVSAIQDEFARGGPLYVADGHHRYETSLAFRAEAEASTPGAASTMAVLTWATDPGLVVLPTHRLLRGLDPELSLEEAETRWSDVLHVEYFPIWEQTPPEQVDALMQQLASSGRNGPAFGLLGLGQHDLFGLLELRGRKPPDGRLPAERSEAWKALDVSVLHTLLIDPLIAESGRPRDDVLSFTRDARQAFEVVRHGDASAAFFLNPTPIAGVLGVADAGDRMPEKSTYFYPKPPAGVVLRDLEES